MLRIISIVILASLLFQSNCFAKGGTAKNNIIKEHTVTKRVKVNVVTVKILNG